MEDAPEKVTIHVAKAFKVIIAGAQVDVLAGVQSVDKAIAEHWYTQAHLAHGGFGSPDYAKAARAASDAAYVKAKAAHEAFVGLEDAAEDAEKAAGLPVAEPAFLRLEPNRGQTAISELLGGIGGDDSVEASAGDLTVAGGAGDDSITSAGDSTVVASQGDDSVEASAGDDSVSAGAGDDSVSSGAGDDSVVAGQGDDSVVAPAAETASAAPAADAVADAYPKLSDSQEKALDRDGDGKPGGAPAGGNKSKHRGGL